ncbi:hypothetical protein HZH68_001749 [Vespula germanica]|uniref:Uncharacterized protein n=1 Tax=Vespula germanica TaxID=30212 RepID=A0A834NW24_VESGE|nr:hypothetical protein HZH68_001749 [Vespula germanica]
MLFKVILVIIILRVNLDHGYKIFNEMQENVRKFWIDAICHTRVTKFVNLYGVLTNESLYLEHFFNGLVRGINEEQCEITIFLKTYVIGDPRKEIKRNDKVDLFFDGISLKDSLETTELKVVNDLDDVDTSVDNKYDVTIERTLKILWLRRQILNVLVFLPFAKNGTNLAYTYDPFFLNKNDERGKLESINVVSKEDIFLCLSRLTHRRTDNMHGYKLNVGLFQQFQTLMKMRDKPSPGTIYEYSSGYNGSNAIILGTIAKYMNFTVNEINPRDQIKYGHELSNGTYVGTLGDIVYGRAEVTFASFFVKTYGKSNNNFEFTIQTGYDSICVFVPKARKIPKWLRIHHMFEPSIWLCSIISPIMVYLMCYVLLLFTRRKIYSHAKLAYKIFQFAIGYPTKLPRSCLERILLSTLSITNVIMAGLFGGLLYKSFSNDIYYKDINLLSELDASELPILFLKYNLNDVFGDESTASLVFNNLRKKFKYGVQALHDVTCFRNASGLIRKKHFYLVERKMVNEDLSPKLHLVKECPRNYYLAYPIPKNSYLLEKLNLLIGRLNQAGLLTLWNNRTIMNFINQRRESSTKQTHAGDKFVPFNLEDMQTSFYLLIIGISPIWTWSIKDRRYDGYDLERGPVFYEAYYPENNENNPTTYQEKRYFDRDAVIERTFQIPTDRREYIEDRSKNDYLDRLEHLRYDGSGGYISDPKFSIDQNYPKIEPSRNYEIARKFYNINRYAPTYIGRIRNNPEDSLSSSSSSSSSLSSKDLENWNSLESYLRFDPSFADRRNVDKIDINRSNFRVIPERDLNQENIFQKEDDDNESLRNIRNNLSAASSRDIQPLEISKEFESIRRVSPRDLQDRNSFDTINTINHMRYPRQQYRYFGNTNNPESQAWISNVKNLRNEQIEEIPRNVDSLPSENIFVPRPQVINYIFSKDSSIERTEKPITMKEITRTNDEPRKYGDNLLQEELNKEEEEETKDKSTKVTSIEISEVPRHKIRHHHGEWLRDFSRGQN